MAKAKKCDRCNKFYDDYRKTPEDNGFQYVVLYKEVGGEKKIYDLCPECMDKICRFLKNEDI